MQKKSSSKTGPAPERVKTDKPWDAAVKDALAKKRQRHCHLSFVKYILPEY